MIGIGSEWHYLVADEPSGDWTKLDYDISGWKTGPAGFGYGDNDDLTDLTAEMKGKQTRIYLRHDFDVGKDPIEELGLVVNFDDAFICYINGKRCCEWAWATGAVSRRKVSKDTKRKGLSTTRFRMPFRYFELRTISLPLKATTKKSTAAISASTRIS